MLVFGHDLSPPQRRKVTEAVTKAEKNTRGEIVVVAARASDDYIHVPIHVATAIALAVPLAAPLLQKFDPWTPLTWASLFLIQLAVFVVVALVLSLPALRYAITPRRLMHKYAHRNAAAQFLATNMSATKGRTGVLIFVSLLERYAEVIGDQAIAEKFTQTDWQKVIDEMLPVLKEHKACDALVLAVERCGSMLAAHFPPARQNTNELPDGFIVLS